MLGASLVERGARQVRLTRFGEEAVLRVREILRSVDEMGDLARASRDRLAGRLRIGMIPTIAPYFLPTAIANIGRRHPELDIHLREALTSTLIQELLEGRLDAAVVALPVSEPSLAEVALFKEQFLLVRPSEEEGAPVPTGKQLRSMRLLLLEEGHCFRDQALSFCKMQSSLSREALDASSLSTLVQMVSAGMGVTLDSRDGRGGGDALGIGIRRPLQETAALADHRHDLAQDKSPRRTASATVRRGMRDRRRTTQNRARQSAPGWLIGRAVLLRGRVLRR